MSPQIKLLIEQSGLEPSPELEHLVMSTAVHCMNLVSDTPQHSAHTSYDQMLVVGTLSLALKEIKQEFFHD